MDVFKVHEGVVGQYSAYVESPAVFGPNAQPLSTTTTGSGEANGQDPSMKGEVAIPVASPKEPAPSKSAQPVSAVHLPNLSLASEGAFSQCLY